MITHYDKLVFGCTVIIAVILMFVLNFCVYSGNPSSVVIEVDGKIYAEYDLADIKGERIIDVKTEYGTNKILISASEVKVVDASCEDKLDVLSKPITKPNQVIVCIPNRLTVRITDNAVKSIDIDRVAY